MKPICFRPKSRTVARTFPVACREAYKRCLSSATVYVLVGNIWSNQTSVRILFAVICKPSGSWMLSAHGGLECMDEVPTPVRGHCSANVYRPWARERSSSTTKHLPVFQAQRFRRRTVHHLRFICRVTSFSHVMQPSPIRDQKMRHGKKSFRRFPAMRRRVQKAKVVFLETYFRSRVHPKSLSSSSNPLKTEIRLPAASSGAGRDTARQGEKTVSEKSHQLDPSV